MQVRERKKSHLVQNHQEVLSSDFPCPSCLRYPESKTEREKTKSHLVKETLAQNYQEVGSHQLWSNSCPSYCKRWRKQERDREYHLAKGTLAQNHQEVEVLSPDHILAPHVVRHPRVLRTREDSACCLARERNNLSCCSFAIENATKVQIYCFYQYSCQANLSFQYSSVKHNILLIVINIRKVWLNSTFLVLMIIMYFYILPVRKVKLTNSFLLVSRDSGSDFHSVLDLF